jgi:galactokinase
VTPELDQFVDTLRSRQLFEAGSHVVVARAPGRLDVMGGIADYSGSLVLQRPIAEATFAAVQLIERPVLEVVSAGRTPCTIALETLAPDAAPLAYEKARQMFAGEAGAITAPHWVSYVAGTFLVLAHERGLRLTSGARVVVASRVPEGKGVSSSAAIETACMHAAANAVGLALEPRDLALLCQKSENVVSGAPCGVMDQMTCVFGQADQLLALLCQPAELQPPVPLPDNIELWGIDSGERHAVGGSDYASVRTGAFIGLRLAAERLGAPVDHLANLSPSIFEKEVAAYLPEEILGDDFLAKYGGTVDTVTRVERGRRYRVRAPAAHPVYERQRAEHFRQLLCDAHDEDRLIRLGRLMFESHAGYSACGLGSPGTDHLVALVRSEGPRGGLFGARITGGGSGGTVAVVGRRGASAAIARVAAAYERITGYRPYIFTGSSPGAIAFGPQSITL